MFDKNFSRVLIQRSLVTWRQIELLGLRRASEMRKRRDANRVSFVERRAKTTLQIQIRDAGIQVGSTHLKQ
jgi:hypothetical protein